MDRHDDIPKEPRHFCSDGAAAGNFPFEIDAGVTLRRAIQILRPRRTTNDDPKDIGAHDRLVDSCLITVIVEPNQPLIDRPPDQVQLPEPDFRRREIERVFERADLARIVERHARDREPSPLPQYCRVMFARFRVLSSARLVLGHVLSRAPSPARRYGAG